jgi:YihY family inner membrane protein
MSTATPVPETWELTGDDARRVLRTCGRRALLRDAFIRLRVADGFSHARSLAYATSLVFVQATIALVGLASAIGNSSNGVIVRTVRAAVPGPAGELVLQAVVQAHGEGVSHRWPGLAFGIIGTLVTGSTLLGQVERGLNRIYGEEQDRPTVKKYGLALLLTVSAGLLAIAAFALLAFGQSIGDSIDNHTVNRVWEFARWPGAVALVTVATTIVFRYSPRRRQPSLSWMAFGAAVSSALWVIITIGLGAFFSLSKSFGQTYGPLAGVVALLVWALLAAIALLYGGAVVAQLEAVRAGIREPQDEEKVEHSESEGSQSAEGSPADQSDVLTGVNRRA